MDIRALRGFVAVAEELHFGRAAKRLHVSQPPLSLLIRTLEEELGVPLFLRTSRHVELTEPGRVLLEEARQVLQHLSRAQQRTEEAARGERGSLTIGFITPLVYAFLPDLLRRFREKHPGVRLTLREETSDVQLKGLARSSLHVGFVAGPVPRGEFAARTVLSEPLLAALPARHKLARVKTPLSAARLHDEPFICFPRPSAPGLFDHIVGFCRGAGFSPRIEQEAVQSQTIVALVSAGLGVAIVPASIGQLRRPGVVYRPFRERSPRVETVMAWRDEDAAPALQNFVKLAEGFRS